MAAAHIGHLKAAKILVCKPGTRVLMETVYARDYESGVIEATLTALHLACIYGHLDVLKVLLTMPQIQINRG